MQNLASYLLLTLWIFIICSACEIQKKEAEQTKDLNNYIPYTIVSILPHEKEAYTQGLVYHQDKIYESTGTENSWIALVNPYNGAHDKKVVLDPKYFGEGITILNNKVYQLTWKDKTGFIYDLNTFSYKGSFFYDFDGWGLTTDGTHLIVSDGTEKIYYLDTLKFNVQKTLSITENRLKVEHLNELEFIDGYIFANQWETPFILKINPETEQVVGKLDLSPFSSEIKRNYPKADVLNGIAYNPRSREILVTGKRWPKAWLIRLNE